MSSVGIWAFLRCPLRHWFAKFLTLLFLFAILALGVTACGSFIIHALGRDFDFDSFADFGARPLWGFVCIYALAVWTVGKLASGLWRALTKLPRDGRDGAAGTEAATPAAGEGGPTEFPPGKTP